MSQPDRGIPIALAHSRWIVVLVAAAIYAMTVKNAPVLDDGWVIFDNSSEIARKQSEVRSQSSR